MTITYLGHATCHLEATALAVLIDPFDANGGGPVPSTPVVWIMTWT
jgi:L-ascorbate metabolism protein UlaG (beta-lactamase superfamily)